MKPLVVDLYCGLGGWAEGCLAEGFDVVGFDIERHVYGSHRYPAQLVIQDVTTLHGSQFKDAALIVASPPCQEFSYMAMPWSRAKAKAAAIRVDESGRMLADLTALFDACFRIQAQASIAAGRHIPMIVENVKGAQPWVGRSRWNFGSFHLWGDVPALMPITRREFKVGGIHLSKVGFNVACVRKFAHGDPSISMSDGRKGIPHRTDGHWTNPAENGGGIKQGGSGAAWWRDALNERRKEGTAIKNALTTGPLVEGFKGVGGRSSIRNRSADPRPSHGNSTGRKAASAMIAKIPLPLARHIAATYRPPA